MSPSNSTMPGDTRSRNQVESQRLGRLPCVDSPEVLGTSANVNVVKAVALMLFGLFAQSRDAESRPNASVERGADSGLAYWPPLGPDHLPMRWWSPQTVGLIH